MPITVAVAGVPAPRVFPSGLEVAERGSFLVVLSRAADGRLIEVGAVRADLVTSWELL